MKLEDLLTRNLWARVKSPLSQSKQNGCILSMIVVEAVHLYHLKFEGSERGGENPCYNLRRLCTRLNPSRNQDLTLGLV